MLALAGRVASDLTEIIRQRPREMADFLRAAKEAKRQLLKRDLRVGLEHEAFRNARLAPARGIVRPLLRQIQPVGDRQARMAIG